MEMSKKVCKRVEMGEIVLKSKNTISPMWKKHQNLLSNNIDAPSITKYGSLVRLDTQIVALRAHCARTLR